MSFGIDNKLAFLYSFKSLSSLLDSLVKNLKKIDFIYFSQELDGDALDLVKQKLFYPYEYLSNFEKLKKELPNRERKVL